MKPDPIKRLWQLARRHETPPPGDSPLPNATRIAARWAATRAPGAAVLWERVCAASCVVALGVCGTAALLRPAPQPAHEPDLMMQLFIAQPAPAAAAQLPF